MAQVSDSKGLSAQGVFAFNCQPNSNNKGHKIL
jgi:hypothetical protein